MCLLANSPPSYRWPSYCRLAPWDQSPNGKLVGEEARAPAREAACRRRARGHVEPLAPGPRSLVHAGPALTTAPSRSHVRAALLAALCLATLALTIAARCYATGGVAAPDLPLQPHSIVVATAPVPNAGPIPSAERTLSVSAIKERTKRAGLTSVRRVDDPPSSGHQGHQDVVRAPPGSDGRSFSSGGHSASETVQKVPIDRSDINSVNQTSVQIQTRLIDDPKTRDNQKPEEQQDRPGSQRPMPSAHDQPANALSGGGGERHEESGAQGEQQEAGGGRRVVLVATLAALLTVTLGLLTCVLSYYRTPHPQQTPPNITAPMLSVVSVGGAGGVVGGMERLHGRERDRQVRLHSVHHDLQIDLPPSIRLPDGEEIPYGSSHRLHIRDPEQESEISQKCIRPPPNRTVFESESPPPYRSSSAGLLGSATSSSAGSSDWSAGSQPLVVRCHSMSSTSGPTTAQAAIAAAHRRSHDAHNTQKTDFIQRTVKIFTKRSQQQPPPPPPPPAPTLPSVLVVPAARTPAPRRTSDRPPPHV